MRLFQVNAQPGRVASRLLPLLPFIICIIICVIAYITVAHIRHMENPKDKLVPTVRQLADGFRRSAFEPDRKGEYRLLADTIASVRRIAISVALLFPLLFLGVVLGLHMGVLPYAELLLRRSVLFINKTPPLVVVAVLLIPGILTSFIFTVSGLGEVSIIAIEVSNIAIIVIGSMIVMMPPTILDTYLRAKGVLKEQIAGDVTLNASGSRIIYRIALPRIFPKVLEIIRLKFWVVILLSIVVERGGAGPGLGYRIFLLRRYVAMDIIIPYIIWIGFLAFLADLAMRVLVKRMGMWVERPVSLKGI